MIKEFLAHVFISVESKEHLTDAMIDAATKKFEESLAESLVQDDISDILFSSIPYCPLPDVSQQQQGFKGITFCAFMQRENYTSGQRIPPNQV